MAGTTRWWLIGVSSAVLLGLAACQDGSSGAPDDGGHADLAHIHGLGINPADGELYAGTHHGVFRIPAEGEPEQVAGRTQDFMGFTILGPDHFLSSGHPGPDDAESPPNLGLLESNDGAKTWQTRSLSGEVDFHALEAKHGRVYGYDSQTGQLMVSKDETTWDRRAQEPLADIAVSPADPDVVLATMQEGPARSTDGGRTFTTIDGAPPLVLLDWPSDRRLVGVGPDGVVYTSSDGGETWAKGGGVPGQPAAMTTHGKAEVYVATDSGVHRSVDGGNTFTMFQALE